MVTLIQVVIYGLVTWLGCYLIARDLSSWRLRFAGLALISYGMIIAIASLDTPTRFLSNLSFILLFIPPIFWFGTIFESLPQDKQVGSRSKSKVRYGLLVLTGGFTLLWLWADFPSWFLSSVFPTRNLTLILADLLTISFFIFFLIVASLIILSIFFLIAYPPQTTSKRLNQLIGWVTFFFVGGYVLFAISLQLPSILMLSISVDLLILGMIMVMWDAMDAGESLLPDMLRSFTSTCLMIFIVVVQVVIITPEITDSTLILIFALITTVIVVFAFEVPIQNRLDRVIFSRFPHIRQQRQQQRVIETATIRRAEHPLLDDETEFIRYTRRALSHYGDLSKLATNPLTQLTIIEHRLNQRGAPDDSLERAKELKNLLHESILRLKPNGAEFGISDEWRYYNALYFPYVAGLKPYSIRAMNEDKTHHDVLMWFRSQVPERTLYNWQNAAASLIAKDLRERMN